MKPSELESLSDDARLLLVLAGEWPGDAPGAPTGGGASADLRDAFARFDGPLTVDAARQTLPAASLAARAVVRAMQDRAAADVPAPRRRKSFRIPGWVIYPAAAAAVLALAMVGWWYQVHDQLSPTVAAVPFEPGPPVLVLRGNPLDDSADGSDEQIVRGFDTMIINPPGGGEAERQYAALKFLEDSVQ